MISQAYCERISTSTLSFLFRKEFFLCFNLSTNNYSFQESICACIPSQVSKKRKKSTCMLILEMWHDCFILTTFLLYLLHHGDVHKSFISGFRCTVNFDSASVSPVFSGRLLNARCVNLSWRLIELAVHLESNNILSIHSYFQSNSSTFLRHLLQVTIQLSMKVFSDDNWNHSISHYTAFNKTSYSRKALLQLHLMFHDCLSTIIYKWFCFTP